jgi:hypothetical protein
LFPSFQKLDLSKIADLEDLDWLASLTDPGSLEIGGLSKVQSLQKLNKLTLLSNIKLDQLKSLSSVVELAALPEIARFHIDGMNQIPIEVYLALATCSSVMKVTPGYSSKAKPGYSSRRRTSILARSWVCRA